MLVLVFDTSTSYSTVGWVRFAEARPESDVIDFAQVFMPAHPGHAEVLLDRIASILGSGGHAVADVQLIVHGAGPGTFTGLRIGLSTARAFQISNGIPAVGISTLRASAASARTRGSVVSMIDARRGELYVGAFAVDGEDDHATVTPIMDECVLPAAQVFDALVAASIDGPCVFAGNGASAYPEIFAARGRILPTGRLPLCVLWMAREGLRTFCSNGPDDPRSIGPTYLRAPDAKLPGEKKTPPGQRRPE